MIMVYIVVDCKKNEQTEEHLPQMFGDRKQQNGGKAAGLSFVLSPSAEQLPLIAPLSAHAGEPGSMVVERDTSVARYP